ncbi:MAG TPA: RagB/SusD family nutrient uptake outer membrane protein [Bacteroidales bacterium]|nr:RagB/SusD family nutrient uptake outer membrane protein [Bacteroidales bacterium]
MKNKIKYIIIALTLMLQTGCNDWVELMPPNGLVREEFWQSKEDVEAMLMGAYSALSSLDNLFFIHGEARGDMVDDDTNLSGNIRDMMNGNIYPDNWYANWQDFYTVINYANEIIANAPGVQSVDDTFTDYQLQGFLAEAYFIRSLTYFYLVRIYNEVPYVTEPSETDESFFYPEKSSAENVLNSISEDLRNNRQYLSSDFISIRQIKGRASKAACNALLADIALWQFEYEKVIEYVQEIEMDEFSKLVSADMWFYMFYPGNSNESIFELQFDERQSQRNSTYGMTNYDSHNFLASNKAIEMFSLQFADEPFRGQGATVSKENETTYTIWKYVGLSPDGVTTRPSNISNTANWIVYRHADVLLMKAEALSQLERFEEALSILNRVRDRAGVNAISLPNSATAYEDAILNERALELAYEGKRWFDLVRMGRRNDYARSSNLVNMIIENVPATQKRVLGSKLTNPMGWYMPIYEDELERNKYLEQNPYYLR